MICGGHSGFGDQGNSATYTIEVAMASNQESSQGGGKGQENNKNKELGGGTEYIPRWRCDANGWLLWRLFKLRRPQEELTRS
jgi:hypothetical protein